MRCTQKLQRRVVREYGVRPQRGRNEEHVWLQFLWIYARWNARLDPARYFLYFSAGGTVLYTLQHAVAPPDRGQRSDGLIQAEYLVGL